MAKGINFYQLLTDYLKTEDKEKTKSIELKKQFNLLRRNGISESNLDTIRKQLMDNYDRLKDIKEINEILQLITMEYASIKKVEDNEEIIDRLNQKINDINVSILGNNGTEMNGLSYKELEDIIKWKLEDSDENLLNRDDIINMLQKCSSSNDYNTVMKYNNLIKNVVIPYTENDIERITNPRTIGILKDLALYYMTQGDYENSKVIYEKCIELFDKLEDKEAIQEEFKKLLESKDIVKGFANKFSQIFVPLVPEIPEGSTLTDQFLSLKNVNNLSDIEKGMKENIPTERVKKVIPGVEIPRPNNPINPVVPNNGEEIEPKPNIDPDDKLNEPMTVQQKVEGIQYAIRENGFTIRKMIKFNDSKSEKSDLLRELQSKISDYQNYILIDIEELNVSLLECLTDDTKSLQIIPNEYLSEILQFEKVRDQKIKGSVTKNHRVKTFGENLKAELDAIKKLRDEGKPIDFNRKNKKYVNKPKEIKPVAPTTIDPEEFDVHSATMGELIIEGKRLNDKLDILTKKFSEMKQNTEELKNEAREKEKEEELRKEIKDTLNKQSIVLNEIKDRMSGNGSGR